ncbi:SGNH/GDSL hydrolase family protein [Cryptosporangium aurantiacum]|uniref:Lysophospholipase L1 n=1 Tax=Cryptosporangium aurantiacum TaxID=134849 RepID=A0A1M7HBM2_9ACTN|nr:SGNH/GDSL hydrolase family protein [Cryptosporangium aurantiacum]SHM25869.1 Lysophospholipase L1 [Cryptosporangium aurantiacum]
MTQPVGRLHAAISRRIPHLPDAAGPLAGSIPDGDGPPLSVLFVGDSSVAGVGAGHHGEALAGQFSAALAEQAGRPVAWRVLARSGDTVRGITALVTAHAEELDADLVVLSAGTNDALRLRRPSAWRADVSILVDAVRERLGRPVPVLLVGIPPVHRFGSLPRPIRWSIGGYAMLLDRQLARLCAARPDLCHLTVGALPTDTSAFFSIDRFHPSPTGYRAWARLLAASASAFVLETALLTASA